MRRFLASAWFPFLTCLILAGATVAAYALVLKPSGADLPSDALNIGKIAGWATGPVMALLSLIVIFILNGIRRLLRIRMIGWLHPVIVLIGIAPWAAFAWQMVMNEPRYTPVARVVIDFAGKPLFLGVFAAIVFVVLMSLLALLFRGTTSSKRT